MEKGTPAVASNFAVGCLTSGQRPSNDIPSEEATYPFCPDVEAEIMIWKRDHAAMTIPNPGEGNRELTTIPFESGWSHDGDLLLACTAESLVRDLGLI